MNLNLLVFLLLLNFCLLFSHFIINYQLDLQKQICTNPYNKILYEYLPIKIIEQIYINVFYNDFNYITNNNG